MLIIGLLIVVAAAAFAGAVVSENWGGTTYTVHGFGHVLGHLTLAEIFLSGVALTAIFFLGLWVASVSSRIRRRTSDRRRADARATREERDALLAERDRLARELDAERAAHPVVTQEVPVMHDPAVTQEFPRVEAPVVRTSDSLMGAGDQVADRPAYRVPDPAAYQVAEPVEVDPDSRAVLR